MKLIFQILILLGCNLLYCQHYEKVIDNLNNDLNLSDTLLSNEIRIYQDIGITNYSSAFRIYIDSIEWKVEFYERFANVNQEDSLRIEKTVLKSKNDIDYVFENLKRSYIHELPGIKDIKWKLKKRGNIVKVVDTNRRGEISKFYYLPIVKTTTVDCESFYFQAKTQNRVNAFYYHCPKSYLRKYPDIDELIYVNEILDIIQTEFNIWKE